MYVVAVMDTFTSAVLLALFWTIAGLLTRLYEDSQKDSWARLVQTTALSLGITTMVTPGTFMGLVCCRYGLSGTDLLGFPRPPSHNELVQGYA
jgi:uncharacterized membrane protein YhaH (DUF805 family)